MSWGEAAISGHRQTFSARKFYTFFAICIGVSLFGALQSAKAGVQEIPSIISIEKRTIGGDGTFNFTGTDPLGMFSIDTSVDPFQSFSGLNEGTYVITESENSDFFLDNIECSDFDEQGFSFVEDIPNRSVTFNLGPENIVACTFTNVAYSSITINKSTDVDGTFSFSTDGLDPSAFDISTSGGSGSQQFTQLRRGTYVITESANDAFALENISCNEGESTISVDTMSRSVTIDLVEGEDIACTFTNSAQAGDITIIKQVTGDDGTFKYTGDLGVFSLATTNGTAQQSFSDLSAGIFNVTEGINDDFLLQDISCSGDLDNGTEIDLDNRIARIDLDPNESITCTFTSKDRFDEEKFVEDVKKARKGFAYRRALNMLNSEPDRTNFYRRNPDALWEDADDIQASGNPVRYAANITQGAAQVDVAASTGRSETDSGIGGVELWVEGHYNKSETGAGPVDIESDYAVVHVGADVQVTERIVVGGLISLDKATEDVQLFDEYSESLINQEHEGTGWMAGPYLSARLAKNVFFNTRVAFGATTNQLTFPGIVTDDEYETDRVLARAAVTGNKLLGSDGKWRITPTASVSYFKEDINRYTSKTGVDIPSQSLTLGRAEFEPEIAYRHETASGTSIEPQIAFAAVWDFDKPDDFILGGTSLPTDEFRGRVEGGLQVNWKRGNSMRLAAGYDGIGSENYDAYNVQAWFDVPLNKPQRRTRLQPGALVQEVQYKTCPDKTQVLMTEECEVRLVEIPTPPEAPEPVEFIIYFDFDKSVVSPSEMKKIDEAVQQSQGRIIAEIVLEGNTDRAGSNKYNEGLSLRRAIAVRKELNARGIPLNQIRYEAFGELRPAVPTNDGVRLRANRRTEVRIRFLRRDED